MCWVEIWKISEFLSENFQFFEMKFSIYLNRRVSIMDPKGTESINQNLTTPWAFLYFFTAAKLHLHQV